jgi:hypothetical protein
VKAPSVLNITVLDALTNQATCPPAWMNPATARRAAGPHDGLDAAYAGQDDLLSHDGRRDDETLRTNERRTVNEDGGGRVL